MRILSFIVLSLLSVVSVFGQTGPGVPPGPDSAAIPVDGGIPAFLISAGIIGAGLLLWKKKK